MTQPIQTYLKLLFTAHEKDVTADLGPDLLSFSYDDKETNEADEISISLKDPTGKWAGKWKPDGGEAVKAYIYSGTTTKKKAGPLYCGKFYIDSFRFSGSPRVVELRGVSIPLNKPIRRKIKNRAWEKLSLKGIASKIAEEAELKLFYDVEEDPEYDRQDQDRESDLTFLSRLCEEAGFSIKVTDTQLVIYDQSIYEKKDPVQTITLGKSNILSWDLSIEQSEEYKSCTVSYRDTKQKKRDSAGSHSVDSGGASGSNPAVMSYTFTDPLADENGQEYQLKRRAKSINEAKRLARAKLRELNRRRVTGSLSMIGDTKLVAGAVVELKGFGTASGRFFIESASHSVDGSGYVVSLSIRRVNTNY